MKIKFDIRDFKFQYIDESLLKSFIEKNDLDILHEGERVGRIIDENRFWLSSYFCFNQSHPDDDNLVQFRTHLKLVAK